MLAVNYSTLRNNLKGYCDKVTDENEIVIVTRKGEKNVVILSLDAYNSSSKIQATRAETKAIKRPRSEAVGFLKGKVWMADDFNEPLEELKEYME